MEMMWRLCCLFTFVVLQSRCEERAYESVRARLTRATGGSSTQKIVAGGGTLRQNVSNATEWGKIALPLVPYITAHVISLPNHSHYFITMCFTYCCILLHEWKRIRHQQVLASSRNNMYHFCPILSKSISLISSSKNNIYIVYIVYNSISTQGR